MGPNGPNIVPFHNHKLNNPPLAKVLSSKGEFADRADRLAVAGERETEEEGEVYVLEEGISEEGFGKVDLSEKGVSEGVLAKMVLTK